MLVPQSEPVRIQAPELVLRAFTASDLPDLLAAFSDEEIARWNPGPDGPEAASRFLDERNDWSDGRHTSWAVSDRSERLVGSVSLHRIDREQRDAELGYWTAPWARRAGYAAGAVGAATRFAFAVLDLHRVYLYHAVQNAGSCRVAATAGFTHEGTLRQSYRYADGAYHDEHLHARLSTDGDAC